MNKHLDDMSSDEDEQFHTGLGFKNIRRSKDDEIYGSFLNDMVEIEENEVQKPQQQYNEKIQQRPKLYLFQEEFEQIPIQKQETIETNANDKLKQIHKEYMKNQAFGNFKKSDNTLTANVDKGVTVKIVDSVLPQPIKKDDQNGFKLKKNKSVQFKLENNTIHNIEKFEDENLTKMEKIKLASKIRMHQNQLFFNTSSDEEIEEENNYNEDIIKIVVQNKPKGVKSILKLNQTQLQDNTKKTITFETIQLQDFKKNQKLSIKEKKNLEKQAGQHDYGIGERILQLQGFKYGEGLGANKQGILEPVLAVRKQAFTGQSDLRYEFQQEDDETIEEQNENKSFNQNKKLNKYEKQWRKKKKLDITQEESINNKREEVLILDRNHIMENLIKGKQSSINEYKIIDMTNGLNTNYLNNNQDTNENIGNKQVKEYLNCVQDLTWSVQNLLEKKLSKFENNEQKIKKEQDQIILLEHDMKEEIQLLTNKNTQLQKRENFLNHLINLNEDEISCTSDKFPLYRKFADCFRQHCDQFIQFNIIGLLIKQTELQIQQEVKDWKGPINSKFILFQQFELIENIITLSKDVYIQKKSQNLSKYAEEVEILIINNQIQSSDIKIIQRYIGILIQPIINKLRNFIQFTFDPTQDNSLLQFLELWCQSIGVLESDDSSSNQIKELQLIDDDVIKDILNLIIPKLRTKLEEWNIESNIMLHKWLLPWVQSKLNTKELQNDIELKLKQQKFTEQDNFGYDILIPWQNYLGEKWNLFIMKVILPKMLFSIKSLKINPSEQNIQPVRAVLKWKDEIEQHYDLVFSPLIEKLNTTLNQWIDQKGNQNEIHKWLYGWEQFLSYIISKVYKFEVQFSLMKESSKNL